ncbi:MULTISPECIES: hypothetical protein [Anaerofustis]|uniref:hypothetical protein n=1 Tax=Anaerofustis TaxID=264995 RepID=UPI0011058F70|nr:MULTISPECIES: hypothetical protein [Anaerofustis]MCO8194764.1 hypothetical protein [Anaerofustis sp. NSJ-163]
MGINIFNKNLKIYRNRKEVNELNYFKFIPENYITLKKNVIKKMGLPKGTILFCLNTNCTNALLLCFKVNDEISMPFDDVQSVIDSLHDSMDDNTGIIEVSTATTKLRKKIIYTIIKHKKQVYNDLQFGVEYTLNLNIKVNDEVWLINGSFCEEGITGYRDNIIYTTVMENINLNNPFDEWMYDPYDKNYIQGYLMNISEKPEYDLMFPEHPLSELRGYIKYIIENN